MEIFMIKSCNTITKKKADFIGFFYLKKHHKPGVYGIIKID